MTILDTHEVTKRFGGLTAVNKVSMKVEDGQIYGLIGPNGAGKTTFLNSIAGYFPPTLGKVMFLKKKHDWLFSRSNVPIGHGQNLSDSTPIPQAHSVGKCESRRSFWRAGWRFQTRDGTRDGGFGIRQFFPTA